MKKSRKVAREYGNDNILEDDESKEYLEPFFGWSNNPGKIPNNSRHPLFNNPHHYNETLVMAADQEDQEDQIESQGEDRVARLARRLLGLG